MMFHSAALQNLGKIKNPATDKVEKNLEQAQAMIDMLEMLSKKTRGNTTDEERKFLSNVLQELKLNYVDEVTKQQTEIRE